MKWYKLISIGKYSILITFFPLLFRCWKFEDNYWDCKIILFYLFGLDIGKWIYNEN